jgi:hypothetical protein
MTAQTRADGAAMSTLMLKSLTRDIPNHQSVDQQSAIPNPQSTTCQQ